MCESRPKSPLLGGLLLLAAVAATALGDQAPRPILPNSQQVYIVMRDLELAYEDVRVSTVVPNEQGASALVRLNNGTLVDLELVAVRGGWSLRDIFYVAGNAESFRSWSAPWRRRVRDAQRFLASAGGDIPEQSRRRARELAPLVWFEDLDERNRLWGLNPVTYRLMQTLRMMPALGGPMGASGSRR